jgi:hypothetical protein
MDYPTCCKYGHLLSDIASSGNRADFLKNKHLDVWDDAIPYFLRHHLIHEHEGDPDRAPQRFTLTPEGQTLLDTFKAHLPKGESYDADTQFDTSPPSVSEEALVAAFPHSMTIAERFQLQAGRDVWASLEAQPDGKKLLHHRLNDLQVVTCGGLAAYDNDGHLLGLIQHGGYVSLNELNGRQRLTLQTPTGDIAITDVIDPKGQVQLVVKLTGAGSAGNDPLKDSGLVFNLRWIGPRV